MNSGLMSTHSASPSWRVDLKMARNVPESRRPGFEMVLSWFEDWRIAQKLEPGREAARAFWIHQVKSKPRQDWQLDQWKEALGWYLEWLRHAQAGGMEVRSLEERVYQAVDRAGGRRGLALRTRETYGRWAVRYARSLGDARSMLQPEHARDFLGHLVTVEKQSFSTQKQALNALAFFFKEVCGQAEVDLQVRLRKTTPRVPVVVNFQEILAILKRLEEPYRLMAEIQYGGGLRLKELAQLRVKDVDLERRQITIRQGKGDLDRVTVLPEQLVEKLRSHLGAARTLFEADRTASLPGVALPGALARKFSAAGTRWEWFWIFPAPEVSRDPESGIVRRHHIHPGCYSNALRRAVQSADIAKRVTSHAFRHAVDAGASSGSCTLPLCSRASLRSVCLAATAAARLQPTCSNQERTSELSKNFLATPMCAPLRSTLTWPGVSVLRA